VTAGGLISYRPDNIDPYRRAADYLDRILKGVGGRIIVCAAACGILK
jgi:hypothetical protein